MPRSEAGPTSLLQGKTHNLRDWSACLFTANFAAAQALGGATVSLSDNSIVGNSFAFGCSGGTLASTGDNRIVNNQSNGCSPNGVVVVQ